MKDKRVSTEDAKRAKQRRFEKNKQMSKDAKKQITNYKKGERDCYD